MDSQQIRPLFGHATYEFFKSSHNQELIILKGSDLGKIWFLREKKSSFG